MIIPEIVGLLLIGFGLGFASAAFTWSRLVKQANDQNKRLIETWSPLTMRDIDRLIRSELDRFAKSED